MCDRGSARLSGIDGHEVFGFSLIALCSAGLLTNAFEPAAQTSRFLLSRIVGWFGSHSYELYLFHIILLAGIRDLLPRAALPYAFKLPLFAAFVAASGVFAGLAARYFADPVNGRLRRHLASDAKNMT